MYNYFNKSKSLIRFCFVISALAASLLLSSCAAPEKYKERPLLALENIARYRAYDVNSKEFEGYLISQNYPQSQIPVKVWDLAELSLSAYFYHPSLDVARAQLAVAEADILNAKQSPTPSFTGTLEHHSNQEGGIPPWSYGIGLNIPIERDEKRLARIDKYEHLSELAKVEIASRAWQVRRQVRDDLIALQASRQQILILHQELALRSNVFSILEARFKIGLLSSSELSAAHLALQKTQHALSAEQSRVPELRAALASSAGLTLSQLAKITIQEQSFSLHPAQLSTSKLMQDEALFNRLEVRAGLERYAASEANLRLEIAKQYPDITFSPAYLFDQSDHVWSLGISALLNLLQPHQNKSLIAKANALRSLEAAQFYALQATIIGEMERSLIRHQAASDGLLRAESLLKAELNQYDQIERQFNKGIIDRLALVNAQINILQSKQNVLSAKLNLQYALASVEEATQKPLNPKELVAYKYSPRKYQGQAENEP